MYCVPRFKYCTLLAVGVGAVVCTKFEGGGLILVRESLVGCGSTVSPGNSPALIRCWLTAASVALVMVFIVSRAWRGEISSLTGVLSRCARGAKAGVGFVRGRGGDARRSTRYVQFVGEMMARCHRLGLGRDRTAERLARYVDNRRRSRFEHPNWNHCQWLMQSLFFSPFPVRSRGHPFAVAC